jgi:hypothetical protein
LRIDKRPTGRLVGAETLQCVLQGQGFGVGVVDHLVTDVDPLASGRGDPEVAAREHQAGPLSADGAFWDRDPW